MFDDVYSVYNVYSICQSLKIESGRLNKEAIILAHKDNVIFQKLLKFLLDKNITTGIDMKRITKSYQSTFEIDTGTMLDVNLDTLLNLATYEKVDNDKVASIRNIIEVLCNDNENVREFLIEVVTKSLRLGVDAITVNKVFGYQLIPTFDIMLGTPIEQCSIPGGTWFSLSHKLNGTRCVYYKGKLYSRSGKEYTGCEHIIKQLQSLENYVKSCWLPGYEDGCIFDGELLLKDRSAGDSESFQISTGIANSKQEMKEELCIVVFDVVPRCEFEKKVGSTPYIERKMLLSSLDTEIRKNHGITYNAVSIVDFFYSGCDQEMIWKYLEYAETHDMEGLMINLDTPYEFKRTKNLIKVKKFFDIDLECTGIMQGEKGKYKNTLGAIVCKFGDNEVKVGSGFSEELRNHYFNHPEDIVGHIVSVKYKEITQNKSGGKSLQFPVFLAVREDKEIPDNV